MSKLKIAMIIDAYDTKTGGVISTRRFVDKLREAGHKVIVISTGKKEEDKVVLKEFYPPFGKRIMKKMKMVFAWPDDKKIKEVLKQVDVVHIQLPFYLSTTTISLAKEMKLPIVSSFHVQAENITKNIGVSSSKVIKQIYRFFINRIYNRSDLVICPSKFAQEELKRFGLKSESVILSNGYTEDYYPQRLKRKFPNKFVILMVGRLSAEKRQDKLIEAILLSKYKKDIQLVLIGHGPLKKELKKLGKKLPHRPLFLQGLPTHKLARWYNTSDLYVHCGEIELEGMTVLEAMACGLPPLIVNSKKSASPQFALNDKHLFNDTKDLVEKIDYWYEHPMELIKAKERYLTLSKKYAIKASVGNLEKAYLKVIKINKNHMEKKANDNDNNRFVWLSFIRKLYPHSTLQRLKKINFKVFS